MLKKTIFLILTLYFDSVYAIKLNELNYIGINKFSKQFNIPPNTNIDSLRGGMSSSNVYKINLSKKSFVIRTLDLNMPIQNRLSELNMHKALSKKGLAPNIIFVDNEKDPYIIVMDYINGRTFNPKIDLTNKNILNQIINSLKIIHNLSNNTIHLYNKSMMEFIKDYIEDIKIKNIPIPTNLFKWHHQLSKMHEKYKTPKTIIHGDLSPRNILISNDNVVYFIDFQEVREDSIFAEFGYFFYESGIDNTKTIKSILEQYFNRKISNFEIQATLFYMKATAFLSGIFRLSWIDKKYKSKDLDKILKNLKERGIRYFKKGDYDKIQLDQISLEERTKYVLSFFKDFENMKVECNK